MSTLLLLIIQVQLKLIWPLSIGSDCRFCSAELSLQDYSYYLAWTLEVIIKPNSNEMRPSKLVELLLIRLDLVFNCDPASNNFSLEFSDILFIEF